jgi:glutamine amidotransferase
MAAYVGEPIRLDDFLRAPAHSLIEQAHAPAETLSATVNADGIGIGWYADDGLPASYRSGLPAWADPNLDGLGRSLSRPLWVANVRSATDPLSNSIANTQPFVDARRLFLHNGFIADFAHSVRGPLRAALDTDIEARISGTTDSEYLFALLRQRAERRKDLVAAVRATVHQLRGWLEAADCGALLNLIVADGARLVALRHGHGKTAPSLYLHARHAGFAGGALVASEPLDGSGDWVAVPEDHIVTLEAGDHVDTVALD